MEHKKTVEKYNGSLKELSRDIVDLEYDTLVELFKNLKEDFKRDAKHDKEINHPQVAEYLLNISVDLGEIVSKKIEPLAKLCRAYNEKGIR